MDSLIRQQRETAYVVTQHTPESEVKVLVTVHHYQEAATETAAKLSMKYPHLNFEVHLIAFDCNQPLMAFHPPRYAKETALEL